VRSEATARVQSAPRSRASIVVRKPSERALAQAIAARDASNGNDDLASCAAGSEVADRLRNLVERERRVDDGRDRTGFE
jgi:hypothetical protein